MHVFLQAVATFSDEHIIFRSLDQKPIYEDVIGAFSTQQDSVLLLYTAHVFY